MYIHMHTHTLVWSSLVIKEIEMQITVRLYYKTKRLTNLMKLSTKEYVLYDSITNGMNPGTDKESMAIEITWSSWEVVTGRRIVREEFCKVMEMLFLV